MMMCFPVNKHLFLARTLELCEMMMGNRANNTLKEEAADAIFVWG